MGGDGYRPFRAPAQSDRVFFFFSPPVLLVVESWMRSASGHLPGSVLFSIPSLRAVPGRVLEEG